MKRNGIRLLNLLLIMAMIAGLLPGMSVTAIAEEAEPSEKIYLHEADQPGTYPATEAVTVTGYNAEAVGYAWDRDGWPVGYIEDKSYDLTVKTKSGKPIIVKVVFQIGESAIDLEVISDDPNGSISTDSSTLTYENPKGVNSVTFRYNADPYTMEEFKYNFFQFTSATVYYGAELTHSVTVTPGEHMTKTENSGAESQPELSGAVTTVIYEANSGYKFPTYSDSYKTTFGITVERTSDTVVTVSGTPTVDTTVTVPDAVPENDVIMGVSLNLYSVTLLESEKQELTAAIEPADATDQKVKWSVDEIEGEENAVKLYSDAECTKVVGKDPTEVRTVYAMGNLPGSATVTVTSNADSAKTATCKVTVNEPVREWLLGDSINLKGKYFKTSDSFGTKEQSTNNPGTVPSPVYEENQWKFIDCIPTVWGDEEIPDDVSLTPPSGKTAADVPAGFRVKEGNGRSYNPYVFELVYRPVVTITPGNHMTKTGDSGAESQIVLSGAMAKVVYTANDGYYFPADYSVGGMNGITVTRDSDTQITVFGTPTENAVITLTAPTAKEAAVVTKAPEANTLTYNGQAQELVTAGSTNDGTMKYAVTTEDTAPTDESLYTTSITTATDAGTYYVWYNTETVKTRLTPTVFLLLSIIAMPTQLL